MIHLIDLHFQGQLEAIAAFLVETSTGPILIETGPHSTLPRLEEGIQAAGFELTDIKHVFLTHIHLDHAGVAWKFAEHGATIYVHPRGYPHMHDPSKLLKSAKMIYQEQMDSLWGTLKPIAAEQLVSVDHEDSFTIGDTTLKAWHTPGHAVHHIAWQIGPELFTGDVAGVKIGSGPVVPPCPPPDINVEDWQHSLDIIRQIAPSRLWLTHSQGITDVNAHLDALEKRLVEWAAWLKPKALAEDVDTGTLMSEFEKFVMDEFSRMELEPAIMRRYAVANPAGMSAIGLKRYWVKKQQRELGSR